MAGKRPFRGSEGRDGESARKKQKIIHAAPTSEAVHTSRQLKQLLSFTQDLSAARHGLQSFKLLLDGLLDDTRDHDHGHERILIDYLDSSKSVGDDDEPVCIPEVMQTWAYAAQVDSHNLMSAVVVVLALLLRYLSQKLPLVPAALAVCRTLLQTRQLELVARNLAADRSKAFVISPTLRMLREVVCLDGGAVSRPLFRARLHTFASLARNMGIGAAHLAALDDTNEDAKRNFTVRTNAVRFLLSCLQFLPPEAKRELLMRRDVTAALTRHIGNDPPFLVLEILGCLKAHVLRDKGVKREAKAMLLDAATLIKIAALYSYRPLNKPSEDSAAPIADAAHEFLMAACTMPSSGVLRPDLGFYPRDVDPDAALNLSAVELEDLGLESVVWMDRFKTEVPVRNFALSHLVQHLRPWSSVKHGELAISIFRVAPELVAHYFVTSKGFTFEPKLSATWIGYAAFIFNMVALPIPDNFGRPASSGMPRLPPPTSIVMDNILPLPLTQKALTRCLTTASSNLIPFFATRILVAAVRKLDSAVKLYLDPSRLNASLWSEATRRLVDEFCQRSPTVKELIHSYRSIPQRDLLHREAASQLLRLYYEVLPQVALMAKFDVSPFLETALSRLSAYRAGAEGPQAEGAAEEEADEQDGNESRDYALSLLELENIFVIAGYSPGMRWFAKSEKLGLSPFAALLRVLVDAPAGVSHQKIRQILDFVAKEQQLVPARQTDEVAILPLVESLQGLHEVAAEETAQIWSFVDNCLTRCATASVKYLELLHQMAEEQAREEDSSDSSDPHGPVVSLVAIAMMDQLPYFAESSKGGPVLERLVLFLSSFMAQSAAAGETRPILDLIRSRIQGHVTQKKSRVKRLLEKASAFLTHNLSAMAKDGDLEGSDTLTNGPDQPPHKQAADQAQLDDDGLRGILEVPDALAPDNSILGKYANKAVDDLVHEGYAASLMSLLASEHTSIRKEGLTAILKVAAKVQQSDYSEREQVWLLLSELAETARCQDAGAGLDRRPLPGLAVSFARHALDVLRDPASPLYPKVNAILTRGPVWDVDRALVPALVEGMLQEAPSADGTYYAQVHWLLGWLLDGLRTPADMEALHRRRMMGPLLEKVLAPAANPYVRGPLRLLLLRVVYRMAAIEGGSTALVTRLGAASWLEALGWTFPTAEAVGSGDAVAAAAAAAATAAAFAGHGGNNSSNSSGSGNGKPDREAEQGGADAWRSTIERALVKRVWDSCDQERAVAWSRGGIRDFVVANLGLGRLSH